MPCKTLMIQGTGSNVGKSLVVAGLCRAFANRGLNVAPFKPQNMSNNAAATPKGGEIGRAQALQAKAARVEPSVHFNPVLLKPENETGSQVVVQGRPIGHYKARAYGALKPELLPRVIESFHQTCAAHDLVIVEGAGSPAEVNLRTGDIANMGFAEAANVPVILLGCIDRGGVIAQLVGTANVISAQDKNRILGFGVNKFRGDPRLFDEGMQIIADHTGWSPIGVLNWFEDAWQLPKEDAQDIGTGMQSGHFKIVVPRLNRIANFDDLDPLAAERDVEVVIIEHGRPLPVDADLILIPGSKSTLADMRDLKKQGWDIDIHAHARQGKPVLGICAGMQLLGRKIHDPSGIEGPAGSVDGLGLLDVETTMQGEKTVQETTARTQNGQIAKGYEIHIGDTTGPDTQTPWLFTKPDRLISAASHNGQIKGTYLHGLFNEDEFRRDFLSGFGVTSTLAYDHSVEVALDGLARQIEREWDLDGLLALAGEYSPAAKPGV